jgi:hypothetical protein
MSKAHEMPAEGMTHTVVYQILSDVGFGVTQIYERVPKEGEDGVDDQICGGTGQRMGSRERRRVSNCGRRRRKRVTKCVFVEHCLLLY